MRLLPRDEKFFDLFSAVAAFTVEAATLLQELLRADAPAGRPSWTRSSGWSIKRSQRVSAVRWGVAGRIVWAWVLTIPMSAAIAAIAYLILRHL
jgi:PiT family inorganic phosphate transporter